MGLLHGLEFQQSCINYPVTSESSFCTLPDGEAKTLDGIKLASETPRDAILFAEREAPLGVYILCRGRVKLSIAAADGKSAILRIARPGEVLGLHAVVSNRPYHASAETMEPCEVHFIGRESFLHFLRNSPEASLRAAQQLSENYHAACEQVRSMGLAHSAMERLAGFLLLSAAKGQPTKQGTRVFLALTHEEIGQMVGLSRETVTRTLSDFQRRRFVAKKGTAMLIRDKIGLERIAGLMPEDGIGA